MFLALDIGGTKTVVASADGEGRINQRVEFATPKDLKLGIDMIESAASKMTDGSCIEAVGVAIGGPLNIPNGTVSPLHQPAWAGFHIREVFGSLFKCSVFFDVDTNVAAVGEYYSQGKRLNPLLYVTVSTGMGGGLITNGKVFRGVDSRHPEIAHQAVPIVRDIDHVECACGLTDCLEALVSGRAIERIYGKPAMSLDPWEWEEVGLHLAQGLRNVATMYCPEVIILGGSVALGGGKRLLEQITSFLSSNLRLVQCPEVVFSGLGKDAPLVGAARIAILGYRDGEGDNCRLW